MRVAELKPLAREHGLRGYSRLRKAELIALLRPAPPTRSAVPGTHSREDPVSRDYQDLVGTLLHLCKHKRNQLGSDQIDRGNQNC